MPATASLLHPEDAYSFASDLLLVPAELDESGLQRQLHTLMKPGVDYADLYFQNSRSESWVLEDGIVKTASYDIEQGVGIRAVSGEKTGFAYSDDLTPAALAAASKAAASIASSGATQTVQAWRKPSNSSLYLPNNPLPSKPDEDKVAFLQKLDKMARDRDSRVEQVTVSLAAVYDVMLVAASDGTLAADIRPLVRVNCSVVVEENGRREQGSSGGGGRYSYAELLVDDMAEQVVSEAVRGALVNLQAVAAPAGQMTVVVGPGWPGVLLHEAVGHGLEGDFNRKGSSVFSGRIGDKVAHESCTVVDDGTLEKRRGSLNIDDEGVPTECTTLIENGILKGYMQDKLNARLTGVSSTGNGRRESFAHLPMPRMTNTYMLGGKHDPQEIIASVKNGIYAPNFGGGQVDITSGKFVFSASEAYLIEDGKVTQPIKGATLIGNGPEVMTQISMVGNDMALDSGVGVCGKDGQSVPVGVGQPTLKIEGITVGGTQA